MTEETSATPEVAPTATTEYLYSVGVGAEWATYGTLSFGTINLNT